MMPIYYTEHGFCFPGRETAYTLESNTCMARDSASEVLLLAPWSDGYWWVDEDGTEVGWLELDGSYFPPPDGYRPL